MTAPNRTHPHFSHGVLVHDNDEELVGGTRAFVAQGLASGGRVRVHGTRDRVGLLREVLGTHPRLEYGFEEELYQAPTRTLFAYQRSLAERAEPSTFWVTGTVPLGRDSAAQAAWNRYESAVNEALAAYPFRALCTYDTRTRSDAVIEAALATHPIAGCGPTGHASPEYVDPAAFLADPLARVPTPPTVPPSVVTTVTDLHDLRRTRQLLTTRARSGSAVPSPTVEDFLLAVHEVAVNGLVHGAPPVHLALWTDVGRLTCLVDDCGQGNLEPMTGLRYPQGWSPMGLWAARQLVDDLFIGSSPSGGCRVLLTAA
jgi:anti-sigma regulatory factor (Ser/Thr protein kinase)